jgi:hypothetical protein
MTRTISTTTHPIGYWVSLPDHISEEFGSHFEHLTKPEQYTLLATLAGYMAEAQICIVETGKEPTYGLFDAYADEDGALPKSVAALLEEIEQLDRQCDGTILALTEALVLNIRYTHVEEEVAA